MLRKMLLGRQGGGSGRASGGVRGGLREASWGVRGPSWDGLGHSWGDLASIFSAIRFRIHFLIDLGAQRVPKGGHLGRPKGAKIDPKTTPKQSQIEDDFEQGQKHSSRPSSRRLGSILGYLDGVWGRLGTIWSRPGEPKSLIFLVFFNTFLKHHDFD